MDSSGSLIRLEFFATMMYVRYTDDTLTYFQPAFGGYYSQQITEDEYMQLVNDSISFTQVDSTEFTQESTSIARSLKKQLDLDD